MKHLFIISILALMIYGALCMFVYFEQDQLLYRPTSEVSPHGVTAIRLSSRGAVLKIWQLHSEAPSALIYFGGNAEDVAANLQEFDAGFPRHAIYLVNYRGYGGSTGRPTEVALISDAELIYDWVRARHSRIDVIGRSLGSGIATALAARRPVGQLILVTPYDSITNVTADHFAWFPAVRWLLRDRYDSLHRIENVRAQVLAVIAERDEVIFRARSDALVEAIPAGIRHTLVIPHATHNDIDTAPGYLPALKAFLGES